jgi:hypothetical protein
MYANGETPVNCVFTARLRGHLTRESLRCALDRVQSKHPLLQAGIHEDRRGRPYFVSNGKVSPIPIKLIDRISDDDWLAVSETEWKNPFDLKQGPLFRLIWIHGIMVSELLLVSPHCISDGMSCITLLREILSLLDQPDQAMPPYKVFNHVRDMIPPSVLKKKGNQFKTTLLSFFARILFSIKPPPKFAAAGKDYVVHWKLNGKVSALLEERCRTEGVSVYAALCVAFLEGFVRVKKERGHNKLLCPVNIRKMIPAIKDDMMFAFAPIIELSVAGDARANFWSKARQLKKDITQKVAALNGYDILLSGEHFHPSVKKLVKHLMTDEGGHDFTFSNLGRLNIPTDYRSFKLETIYSLTVAFPWRNPNTLFVSSFNGQMDFTFMSNTHSLSYEDAIEFKGKGLARLLEELATVKAF